MHIYKGNGFGDTIWIYRNVTQRLSYIIMNNVERSDNFIALIIVNNNYRIIMFCIRIINISNSNLNTKLLHNEREENIIRWMNGIKVWEIIENATRIVLTSKEM